MFTIEIISDADVADFEGKLPEGMRVELVTYYHEFDSTGWSWPVLQVLWDSGVPGSLVAAILYDVIKKATKKRPNEAPPKQIQIDRTEIEFEAGEITRYIEEHIKIEE